MEDIKEIKDSFNQYKDESTKAITELRLAIVELNITLRNMPSLPERPCEQFLALSKSFENHIDEHRENSRDWRRSAIDTGSKVVQAILLSWIAWMVATGKANI